MHILLTDVLACPRCGPGHGLVVLADRIDERRVLDGLLGCSNCRERYAIRQGFVDLRPPGSPPLPAASEPPAERPETEAVKLAALLGLEEGRGLALLAGDVAPLAPGLARLIDGLEVIVVDAGAHGWPERAGVSRLAAGPGLPLHDRSLRGVALGRDVAPALLDEAARVVAPAGRLVVEHAPEDAAPRLEAAGLHVLLSESGVLVAARTGAL